MANGKAIDVYTVHTFDVPNPTPPQQQALMATAKSLAASDFTLMLLASMHVHDDSSLYFNNTPMIDPDGKPSGQLSPNLAACIEAMKKKTPTRARALASFGGGGEVQLHPPNGPTRPVGYWDFLAIQKLIAQYPDPAKNPFFVNLTHMLKTYPGIEGLDLDLECDSLAEYQQFTDTMVQVIQWLRKNNYIAVLCPYNYPEFWCDVIEKVGASAIAWVNLQNIEDQFPSFVRDLEAAGIDGGRIYGGLQMAGLDPEDVRQTFQGIASSYPGIGGGWLWNLEDFGSNPPAAYAAAVAKGLGA